MGAEEVKNTKKITKKQKAVLDFIEQQIDETGHCSYGSRYLRRIRPLLAFYRSCAFENA